jgi:hypothetical protein
MKYIYQVFVRSREIAVRVSRAQAEENRRTVISVASRLFRDRGFDGIGLNDLMKGAGLTQGGVVGRPVEPGPLLRGDAVIGLLAFGGVWVENYPTPRKASARQRPRHRDFAWVGTGDRVGCETKWAVVPARVPDAAQWHVHRILGMPPSECRETVEMRHFKAINTNWTVDRNRSPERRTSPKAIDRRSLRLDLALHQIAAQDLPSYAAASAQS